MNQIAKVSTNEIGFTGTGSGAAIAPQNLAEVVRFAEVMCKAGVAVPRHLRDNAGACMRIAIQALEWEMSPFALADKSYVVNDRIAYEAQLIAAVVNTRSGIKGRLKYAYEGEGDSLQCTVTGTLDGEEYSYTSPRFDQITPKNSPLWKTDPRQQIGYYAARSWARRYTPEVILGVYDRDEAQQFQGAENAKDVTPLQQRLEQARASTQEPQDAQEGFDASHVTRETETLATGLSRDQEHQSDAAAPNTASETQAECPPASVEGDGQSSLSGSSPSPIQECAVKILGIAVDPLFDTAQQRRGALEKAKDVWKGELPEEDHTVLRALVQSADAIIKDEADYEAAVSHFSEMLEIPVETFVKKDG